MTDQQESLQESVCKKMKMMDVEDTVMKAADENKDGSDLALHPVPTTLNGVPVDSKISVKLFDTSKSLFKRLSEDYDDKHENAKKLQAFLDCVLPGEQQKALVSLSRFLGLLPPFTNDGLTALRQLARQDKLQREAAMFRDKSIEAPEPDNKNFSEFFKQPTVEEVDEEKEKEKKDDKDIAALFCDESLPGPSNIVA